MKIEIIKTEIEKLITYDNGFSCKYTVDDADNLISYIFIKHKLGYHYISDIEKLQKILPAYIYMGTDEGRELFPKFKKEEELIKFDNFNNLYHLYLSANCEIRDVENNLISTCLTFSNRFLNVWGFKDKSIEDFYKLVEKYSKWSKLYYDEGRPYRINFLLEDNDFEKFYNDNVKKIHEEESMFYLREMFNQKEIDDNTRKNSFTKTIS